MQQTGLRLPANVYRTIIAAKVVLGVTLLLATCQLESKLPDVSTSNVDMLLRADALESAEGATGELSVTILPASLMEDALAAAEDIGSGKLELGVHGDRVQSLISENEAFSATEEINMDTGEGSLEAGFVPGKYHVHLRIEFYGIDESRGYLAGTYFDPENPELLLEGEYQSPFEVVAGTSVEVELQLYSLSDLSDLVNRGDAELVVEPWETDSVDITLDGVEETVEQGETMDVSATANAFVEAFRWYLDENEIASYEPDGGVLAGENLEGPDSQLFDDLQLGSYWLTIEVRYHGELATESRAFNVVPKDEED